MGTGPSTGRGHLGLRARPALRLQRDLSGILPVGSAATPSTAISHPGAPCTLTEGPVTHVDGPSARRCRSRPGARCPASVSHQIQEQEASRQLPVTTSCCSHFLQTTPVGVAIASRVRVAPEASTGRGWLYQPEQGGGLGARNFAAEPEAVCVDHVKSLSRV
ncbi:unnamed protein product [Rangifer tarandus platyrhynchus]|uniref:Uncharacterized protein n=2 Tax=Rangifer tarandus platyrhynchus TaxID=3082113 RepID=A0AC59ZQ74_RANTA|nr:unnamed protein product [Rangifer tarandus platyrhynchus]